MSKAEQMLEELVSRIEQTDFKRCDRSKDFYGWWLNYRKRYGLESPDWLKEAQDEYANTGGGEATGEVSNSTTEMPFDPESHSGL